MVPTNTNAQVTYRQNDADLHQVFEVPSVTIQVDADRYGMSKTAVVTDWDARTYDITVKAWSAVPPQTMWVDRTDYVADGSVTPSADNEGESHLVYIGSGDNDPVSQDPADYALRKVSSETTGEITDSYWAYDDPETGLVRYTGEIHWRRGFLDYPVADNPIPTAVRPIMEELGLFSSFSRFTASSPGNRMRPTPPPTSGRIRRTREPPSGRFTRPSPPRCR